MDAKMQRMLLAGGLLCSAVINVLCLWQLGVTQARDRALQAAMGRVAESGVPAQPAPAPGGTAAESVTGPTIAQLAARAASAARSAAETAYLKGLAAGVPLLCGEPCAGLSRELAQQLDAPRREQWLAAALRWALDPPADRLERLHKAGLRYTDLRGHDKQSVCELAYNLSGDPDTRLAARDGWDRQADARFADEITLWVRGLVDPRMSGPNPRPVRARMANWAWRLERVETTRGRPVR